MRRLQNFGCLSLVPESHVINVFEKRQAEIPDSLSDFADYLEDFYIGRPIRGNRRRCPRFSISMWNCFNRLDQQLPRSNNSVESWNKAIKNCARENPSIYESTQDLKVEQYANLITGEQFVSGRAKRKRRIKYELMDDKLQLLVSTFYVIPLDTYLKRARALFNF